MQAEKLSYDVMILQAQFEQKSSEFDQAVKKDKVLDELKRIFHEMKILHAKIAELKQLSGVFPKNLKAKFSPL